MKRKLTPTDRLQRIATIIENVDNRAMAVDGPVTSTLHEMTQREMTAIYELAIGYEKTIALRRLK